MDVETIFSLIGSVGFPIVACVALFSIMQKMTQALADLNTSLQIMNERISEIENKLDSKEDM